MKRSKSKRLSAQVGRVLAGLTALVLTTSLVWAQPPTKGEPAKSYKLTWISAFPKTHSVTGERNGKWGQILNGKWGQIFILDFSMPF
jgi:hypothetical protein